MGGRALCADFGLSVGISVPRGVVGAVPGRDGMAP